jgi:hypothetical protein
VERETAGKLVRKETKRKYLRLKGFKWMGREIVPVYVLE